MERQEEVVVGLSTKPTHTYRFVYDCEVGDVGRVLHNVRVGLLQVRYEHAELRAPVAHVIHPHHIEAHKLEHPTQTVTYKYTRICKSYTM